MAAPIANEVAIGQGTNVASFTIPSVHTSQTDYILVAAIYNEHAAAGAAATVSSVTSAGVTWALRKRSNSSTTGGLELWWAHGTGTLAGYTVTVNMTGAYDDAIAVLTVVSGCAVPAAPFDINASLPAAQSAPTNSWTPVFTGISTSSTDDLLLFITGAITGGGTPASGFTRIIGASNGGGTWNAVCALDGRGVTAVQSAATFTHGSALTNAFGAVISGEAIFDALAGSLPPVVATAGPRQSLIM
jgi:hypothetical protein